MSSLSKLFSSKSTDLVPPRLRCREPGPKKTLIIHHYCPHTFNAGDHFVIRSIRDHLRTHLPEATFVPKPVAGNRGWGAPIGLRGKNIRHSNEHADAVILGGSDQYHNWSPRITGNEIRYLQPPLFFIGLGVSSRDIDAPPYIKKPQFLEDIRAANEKTVLSSVRDDATAEFLRELGFERPIVTGCPALFLFNRPLTAGREGPVLLTFPYPLARDASQSAKYDRLIDALRRLLVTLTEAGETCVIVCHDDRDVPPAQELFPDQRIFFSNYVDEYIPLFEGAKFVVGSRLHATILALGMGVPAVNINLDLRGIGFSSTFALSDWNVDYNDPGLKDRLEDRCRSIRSGDLSGLQTFQARREKFREVFEGFMVETAAAIRRGPGETPA